MIQSPAPLSQVGGRTGFFMEHEHEQEGANYDHSHGPACLTLSSQNFIPGDSSAMGNYIEFGGSSSCCAGLEFYDSQGKAEMISVNWESLITRSEEFPSGRQGSPDRNWLSMGNGLDKTADREFVAGNEMQYNQNSPTSFKPEPFVQLSMRSGSFNEESETRTGSQQITQSVDNAPPNHCNSSPLSDGDQSQPLSPPSIVRQEDRLRSHNFPASCVDNTDIDLPSRVEDPVLSLTAFPVQRSTAREPWINRSNRLNEVHEQDHDKKRWAPLKKTARKNNMSAMTTCKDPAKETNNYDHNIVGTRNGTASRACVDCYTTKTPLWRSGPHGPKSLCNACGIRYRKTRRAALSECINGKTAGSPKRKTEENLIHFKKRSRVSMASCKKNIGLGNHSPFQRVFAQDEEEAAVLLMALSCGLVHG